MNNQWMETQRVGGKLEKENSSQLSETGKGKSFLIIEKENS